MKNKKGLSAIVATLIIILLAIVAFGIISVVIRNTVTKGAESIELSGKCLEIEMHATKIVLSDVSGNEWQYDITFSRSATGETIKGIKVLLLDAEGTESVSDERLGDIEPLDIFTEEGMTFSNVGFDVAKVKVVPFFMKKSGDLYYCENSFTDELIVE